MTSEPVFDVFVPLARRNVMRLTIASLFACVLILWGVYLLPEAEAFRNSIESIPLWDAWGFFGAIFIIIGVIRLIKEAYFLYRSLGFNGGWHFRLHEGHLIWDVPEHAHGEELGFRGQISDINRIEYRNIVDFDGINQREYWVHFQVGAPIQLQAHSGVSLPWLVSKVCDEGVVFEETSIER